MSPKPLPRPRPCIITALEIIGLDDPLLPDGRQRNVLTRIENDLGDPELNKLYDAHLSIFNHRVLHVAPIKKPGVLPFWILVTLVDLLPELIALNVVVRGAVTIGEAASSDARAFGPGVKDAERLCDQVADVPRIIVDPNLFRQVERKPELQAEQHSLMQDLGYLQSLVRLDSDGLYFVDYLWAVRKEMSEFSDYLHFVKRHGQLIGRRLDGAKTLDQTSRANLWLWRYHEQVLEQIRADYKLDADELSDLRAPHSPLVYRFSPFVITPD